MRLFALENTSVTTAIDAAENHLQGALEPLTTSLRHVSFSIGSTELNLFLIFKGLLVVIVLQWLTSALLRRADRRLRGLKNMRPSDRTLIMKILTIGLYFLILMVGMNALGIDLTAFSVIGGALGVGIGFGLQKIASNFIAGIILLFEKSIEVDDMIELTDGTQGFIRQTYARYTLMETLDGREILIPNEEFITQRVITWTHTSRRARVEIKVSVAYDSDLAQVETLMLDAARAHAKCLDDPAPNFFVTHFGDSGIDVILYFWIEDIADGRLRPKSDVMIAIVTAFRAHGISIPFPQRELRVMGETELPAEDAKKAAPGVL